MNEEIVEQLKHTENYQIDLDAEDSSEKEKQDSNPRTARGSMDSNSGMVQI